MRSIAPANCLFVPLILLGLVFIYYFTNKYQQFGNFIIFLSSVLRFTANMLCSCNLCICRFRHKGESLHCVICLALSNVINVLGPFVVESHVILSTCTKNLESKEPEFKRKSCLHPPEVMAVCICVHIMLHFRLTTEGSRKRMWIWVEG